MTAPMLGLRTLIYKVKDLEKAKAWYAEAFQTQPYFDQPFYVGFNIGGYELGLDPDGFKEASDLSNSTAYWGVQDIQQAFDRLLTLGAQSVSPPQQVGGEIMVATVSDPWGNQIGLIFNPEFKVEP